MAKRPKTTKQPRGADRKAASRPVPPPADASGTVDRARAAPAPARRFQHAQSGLEAKADLSRILALSDGVFAIVITLLIFEIKVPTSADPSHRLTQPELVNGLLATAPKLISYVATFFIIGIYWTGHHGLFKHVMLYDRKLLWLNNLFLMCVCFMPFPTALLGTYWDTQIGVVMYGLSLCLCGGALDLLWHHATKNHRLVSKNLSRDVIDLGHKRILMAPAAALGSMALSLVSPKLSLIVYVLAAVAYLRPSRLDKHTYQ